jgi:hypothetical protein
MPEAGHKEEGEPQERERERERERSRENNYSVADRPIFSP